jgi:hypothetical protein
MTEDRYRLGKLILLAVFVFGVLIIGSKISDSLQQMTQNGRYIYAGTPEDMRAIRVIDTRSGEPMPAPVPILAHP